MTVVIADVERVTLQSAAAEIGAIGICTDVSSFASVQALADEVKRRFGALHLLCNNAGVASTARLADMSLSDWTWLLGVNLWGVIHGIKAFLPLLKANPDGGYLVNTASVSGFHVTPDLAATPSPSSPWWRYRRRWRSNYRRMGPMSESRYCVQDQSARDSARVSAIVR